MKIEKIKALTATAMLGWSTASFAGIEGVTGLIERTLSDTTYYGNCMILLPYSEPALNCPRGWVSLDCKGSFNAKDSTRILWDSAQLAYAMDLPVLAVITDDKKHNGHCVVERLDVIK